MAEAEKPISTYEDLPIEKPVEFIGLIYPEYGGKRWKEGERKKTWEFVATIVAWQANGGPEIREHLWIRKKHLDNADSTALVRQTPKGRTIEFTGRRPRELGVYRNFVTLVGPIRKTEKRFAVEQTPKKPQQQSYSDEVFGRLRFDEGSRAFVSPTSYESSELTIEFETDDVEKLKEMLPVARTLWGQRDKWFKQWQDKAYRQYVDCMVDEWWQGDQKLTRGLFIQHLGWPCGLTFSIQDDVVRYQFTGWSEELYTDHGIDAFGTALSDMEISFG